MVRTLQPQAKDNLPALRGQQGPLSFQCNRLANL